MTAAIFGLLGVIVGAAMQGLASWLMERRREDWAARKAARLMTRSLLRCRFILDAAKTTEITWGAIAWEIDAALARWSEYGDALAGTIKEDEQWQEIAAAVDSLERIGQRARVMPEESISPDDADFLASISEQMWSASFTTSLIGVAGVHSPLEMRVRRIWRRVRRREPDDETVRRVVRYSYEVEGKEPPTEESGSTP